VGSRASPSNPQMPGKKEASEPNFHQRKKECAGTGVGEIQSLKPAMAGKKRSRRGNICWPIQVSIGRCSTTDFQKLQALTVKANWSNVVEILRCRVRVSVVAHFCPIGIHTAVVAPLQARPVRRRIFRKPKLSKTCEIELAVVGE
jgi:hypothetical protein